LQDQGVFLEFFSGANIDDSNYIYSYVKSLAKK
jgi:hypothetical protein